MILWLVNVEFYPIPPNILELSRHHIAARDCQGECQESTDRSSFSQLQQSQRDSSGVSGAPDLAVT